MGTVEVGAREGAEGIEKEEEEVVEKKERGGAEARIEEKPESERGKSKEEGSKERQNAEHYEYQLIPHAELTLHHRDLATGHHAQVLGY